MRNDAPLRVLVACEFSGSVRNAFARAGHDAWSCDLIPSEDDSPQHIVGDVRDVLKGNWDMLIVAHPPCTRLCNSGVRWLDEPPTKLNPEHHTPYECAVYLDMSRDERLAFMWRKLDEGAALFSDLWNVSHIPYVAIENPVMHKHAKGKIRGYQEFTQSVQPWQFGDWETKRTCLWLKRLQPLKPAYETIEHARIGLGLPEGAKPSNRVHSASPGPNRGKERSRFFDGIADAMAVQWGSAIKEAIYG